MANRTPPEPEPTGAHRPFDVVSNDDRVARPWESAPDAGTPNGLDDGLAGDL